MRNNLFIEFFLTCGANISIISQIFTIDFIRAILIVIIQVVVTVLVHLFFRKFFKIKIKD